MMTRSLSLVAALLVAACSSGGDVTGGDAGDAAAGDASQDGAASDASTSDSSASDTGLDGAGDGGRICNTLANIAPVVALDYVASAPPTPQGGTMVDGTYIMTAAGFYTGVGGVAGPSGITSQVTIQITGSTVQVVSKAPPPADRITAMVVTNGTSLTRTDTCPDTTTQQQGTFTATSTTLVVNLPAGTFPDGGVKTLVETFTKQ